MGSEPRFMQAKSVCSYYNSTKRKQFQPDRCQGTSGNAQKSLPKKRTVIMFYSEPPCGKVTKHSLTGKVTEEDMDCILRENIDLKKMPVFEKKGLTEMSSRCTQEWQ